MTCCITCLFIVLQFSYVILMLVQHAVLTVVQDVTVCRAFRTAWKVVHLPAYTCDECTLGQRGADALHFLRVALPQVRQSIGDIYVTLTACAQADCVHDTCLELCVLQTCKSLCLPWPCGRLCATDCPYLPQRQLEVQVCNLVGVHSILWMMNYRSRCKGERAARQEEFALATLVSVAITLIVMGLTAENSGDHAYATFFLITCASYLKLRWWLSMLALSLPTLAALVRCQGRLFAIMPGRLVWHCVHDCSI